MVQIQHGTMFEEHWLPWRAQLKPINMYFYPGTETDGPRIRLEDQFDETLIDLKAAKTYLLFRPSDRELFMGEILSSEDGIHSSRIDDGPFAVEIGKRKAQDISSSGIVTNRGQYVGRIEVSEVKGNALAPPLLRFVPGETSAEESVRTDERGQSRGARDGVPAAQDP